MDPAAQQAAQQAANCLLNETISDLPKFYGTAKDTVSEGNLIDCIDAAIPMLAWTHTIAFNYFRMALHSNAETWLKLIKDTENGFLEQCYFIKPLFKVRFGKKMDVAKIGQVLDNLKMDPNEQVSQFATKMNTNFSQLCDIIPRGGNCQRSGNTGGKNQCSLQRYSQQHNPVHSSPIPQVFFHRWTSKSNYATCRNKGSGYIF
jgi:hypothetical protein